MSIADIVARMKTLEDLPSGDVIASLRKSLELEIEDPSADEERGYVNGVRSGLTGVLSHVLGELGYDGEEGSRLKWILERERTVQKLREVCARYGDNDWEVDLHLADVIENHLHRHWDEPEEEDEESAIYLVVLHDRHISDQHHVCATLEIANAKIAEFQSYYGDVEWNERDYGLPERVRHVETHDDGPRAYVEQMEISR
mgnify:CR=1 FL=1